MERLQRWYNEDRSRSIQREFQNLAAVWADEKNYDPAIMPSTETVVGLAG
jgi:hypothetical protein